MILEAMVLNEICKGSIDIPEGQGLSLRANKYLEGGKKEVGQRKGDLKKKKESTEETGKAGEYNIQEAK